MIEKILRDYLNGCLTVPVYVQKPEKLTEDSYVVIEKTGRAIALRELSGVRLNTDYNFTDTATKQYRYQAVFVIYWYEEE